MQAIFLPSTNYKINHLISFIQNTKLSRSDIFLPLGIHINFLIFNESKFNFNHHIIYGTKKEY
jgi:hypothetical protein